MSRERATQREVGSGVLCKTPGVDDARSDPSTEWEEHADWWRANFTEGRDPEYEEQLLPLLRELVAPTLGDRILDAGCGEGQVARLFAESGAGTIGCDLSEAQLAAASSFRGPERGVSPSPPLYVRGSLEALPVRGGVFDAAVAVLVLEHVAAVEEAIEELARVTRRDGRVVVVLNHPLFQTPDSGWIDDRILEESYWRVGPYLVEQATLEEVDRGVFLTFHHRPLSRYLNAFVDAGLAIEQVLEPHPPPGFLALAPSYAQSSDIPRVLVVVCRRVATEK